MVIKLIIEMRRKELVNTDPQGRCYNGAHFSSEMQYTGWEKVCSTKEETKESDLAWWKDLGKNCEFRIREIVCA